MGLVVSHLVQAMEPGAWAEGPWVVTRHPEWWHGLPPLGKMDVDVGSKEEGRGSMLAMYALWWGNVSSYSVGGLDFCRLLGRVLGYGLAIFSTSVTSPRLCRRACWRVLG